MPDFQATLPPGPQLFAPAPGPAPPAATNLAVSSKAVAQSFTRLTIVLEISMVVIGLAVTFLVLLVVYVVHRKRNLLQLAEEKPLAGTKKAVPVWFIQHTSRNHNRTAKNWRKGETSIRVDKFAKCKTLSKTLGFVKTKSKIIKTKTTLFVEYV